MALGKIRSPTSLKILEEQTVYPCIFGAWPYGMLSIIHLMKEGRANE